MLSLTCEQCMHDCSYVHLSCCFSMKADKNNILPRLFWEIDDGGLSLSRSGLRFAWEARENSMSSKGMLQNFWLEHSAREDNGVLFCSAHLAEEPLRQNTVFYRENVLGGILSIFWISTGDSNLFISDVERNFETRVQPFVSHVIAWGSIEGSALCWGTNIFPPNLPPSWRPTIEDKYGRKCILYDGGVCTRFDFFGGLQMAKYFPNFSYKIISWGTVSIFLFQGLTAASSPSRRSLPSWCWNWPTRQNRYLCQTVREKSKK